MSVSGGPSSDEADLVNQMLRGNVDAFRQLLRAYEADVFAVCHRILGHANDAEDVTSEVFFEFWERRNRFEPQRASVRTYLLLLARSRSIDRWRSLADVKKTQTGFGGADEAFFGSSPELRPDESLERAEDAQWAAKKLHALDASQRQVLELTYYRGYTQSQIAHCLEIPLGTVKSHLRRGLARLRAVIGSGSGHSGVQEDGTGERIATGDRE